MTLLKDIPLAQMGFTGADLADETAVVTGGGRGIGRELALLLAGLGARVLIAEVSQYGEDTVSIIQARGGKALWIQTDVSDEQSVSRMLSECCRGLGIPSILVNNAIVCPVKPLVEMSVQEWDKVISVNMRGAFLCIKGVLPEMVNRRHGVIVNMVSAPSMPYAAAYAATKQALESLSHSVAGEVEGSGVCVLAYGPGMVETEGGVAAFRDLSGYLGIDYKQMTHSGVNPGYDGLIPAYDSALSLIYVICHAPLYHDQTVMMWEPLPRFIPGEHTDEVKAPMCSASSDKQVAWIELCVKGVCVASRLRDMLHQTEEEFSKLPFLARPMARGGFKKKTGMNILDLILMVQEFSDLLQNAADALRKGDSGSWVSGIHRFQETWHNPAKVLSGLAVYYHEVPSEMARFVRDRQVIETITKSCLERESVTSDMVNLIAKVLAAQTM